MKKSCKQDVLTLPSLPVYKYCVTENTETLAVFNQEFMANICIIIHKLWKSDQH